MHISFSRTITIWALVAVCMASALPARAQILLKPKGEGVAPLRVKSLDAQVKISGQFAQSTLTYVFQNETSQRIEADFLYSVPAQATVTYFAYWYGEEKVVARVVEKERASQIYQSITNRQRDPTLVEMIGKNTFRARIFPVMPNDDLKVELHTVQVLPSDENGAAYTLALRGPEAGKGTFEQLNVRVEGVLDAAFLRAINNFAIPMTHQGSKFAFTLRQSNYLAPRDLRITLQPRESALRAVIFARSAGGDDGFFVLALSPREALGRPRVSLSGVKTSEIAPRNLAPVAARGTLLVTGRYRGSGMATVRLNDGAKSWQTIVPFSRAVEANHLATKLWAARRIEDLSSSAKNQKTVMALSQRFTLPSKWTSWLAIPQEERANFKQADLEAKTTILTDRLAREILSNHGNSRMAGTLRKRLDALFATDPEYSAFSADNSVNWRFQSIAGDLADAWANEKLSDKPNPKRLRDLSDQINHIAEVQKPRRFEEDLKIDAQRWLVHAYWSTLNKRLETTAQNLAREKMSETPDATKMAQWKAIGEKLEHIAATGPKDPDRNFWRNRSRFKTYVQSYTFEMVREDMHRLVTLIAREPKNTPEKAAMQQKLEQFAQEAGMTAQGLDMRWGDPLISVEAPADAVQVIALLPNGEIKRLIFDAASRRWQARFDIPTYAPEGEFPITIVIVDRDGKRRQLTMRLHVDVTAPRGAGVAQKVNGDARVRLELGAVTDTARVAALLPWGTKIELAPSTKKLNGFFALADVPRAFRGKALQITYIVTDRAHNRTTVTVDMEQ